MIFRKLSVLGVRRGKLWAQCCGILFMLSACGGGSNGNGTGAGSGTPIGAGATTSSLYACDRTTAAAAAPRTATYVPTIATLPTTNPTLVYETWALSIDGVTENINVVIVTPGPGVTIHGMVIYSHGISPTYKSLPSTQMPEVGAHNQFAGHGYITLYVARRGYFGSTGAATMSAAGSALVAQYQNFAISSAKLEEGLWKLHASPVTAAMSRLTTDIRFSPYLATIILTGASGGAETSLQVAFDSGIFRAATIKAILRITGKDSALDTNPEAGLAANEYGEHIASNTSPSLWFGGELDPITSLGGLACQFQFFKAASSKINQIYAVPGMGHDGVAAMFTTSLYPKTRAFLQGAGMPGF